MTDKLFITRISSCSGNPDISFTDPMFRRRLSGISKMTIKVIHELMPIKENTKLFFLSFRGEVYRQLKINEMVIKEKAVMPAAFSLSVFNAPVALASMALGLKGGYSAVYPGNDSLIDGLVTAGAVLLSGAEDEMVFVYADEEIPDEYSGIAGDCPEPLAFGLLLNRKEEPGSIQLSSVIGKEFIKKTTPLEFLNLLSVKREAYVSP